MGAASVRCRRYCCAWVSSSLASSSHPPVDLGQRPILTGMASRNRLCASDDDILEPRKADRRGLRCSRHSAGFASLRPRPSVRGYTRNVGGKQIPYLVARAGGYYDPHLKPPNRRPPSPKIPRSGNDASGNPPGLEVYNDDTLGFLRLPVLPALVAGASVTLHPTSGKTGVGDRLTVDPHRIKAARLCRIAIDRAPIGIAEDARRCRRTRSAVPAPFPPSASRPKINSVKNAMALATSARAKEWMTNGPPEGRGGRRVLIEAYRTRS
jgi:hypothetical protein